MMSKKPFSMPLFLLGCALIIVLFVSASWILNSVH